MCRLFAYAHGGAAFAPAEAVDAAVLDQFLRLAEVHRDGWGAAAAGPDGRSFHLSQRSAARDRASFAALASLPLNSLVVHERLASPGIGLVLENQQPFMLGGIAFGHNGTIGDAVGNVVDRPPAYREALGIASSTTRSDSKLYAELFVGLLSGGGAASVSPSPEAAAEALSAAIRLLRRDYPDASYNNVVQTDAFTIMTRAHAGAPICGRTLRRIYEEAGWADRIESYFEIRYASIAHEDGTASVVASSSGYEAIDSWSVLPNDRMLVVDHRDASFRVLPLEA